MRGLPALMPFRSPWPPGPLAEMLPHAKRGCENRGEPDDHEEAGADKESRDKGATGEAEGHREAKEVPLDLALLLPTSARHALDQLPPHQLDLVRARLDATLQSRPAQLAQRLAHGGARRHAPRPQLPPAQGG